MTPDPDNPLPEPSFGWRRLLTYAAFVVNSLLLAWIVGKVNDARSLMWLGLALILSNVLFAVLYMCGASAVDLARIIQSASMVKRRVRVTTPDSTAEIGGQSEG